VTIVLPFVGSMVGWLIRYVKTDHICMGSNFITFIFIFNMLHGFASLTIGVYDPMNAPRMKFNP